MVRHTAPDTWPWLRRLFSRTRHLSIDFYIRVHATAVNSSYWGNWNMIGETNAQWRLSEDKVQLLPWLSRYQCSYESVCQYLGLVCLLSVWLRRLSISKNKKQVHMILWLGTFSLTWCRQSVNALLMQAKTTSHRRSASGISCGGIPPARRYVSAATWAKSRASWGSRVGAFGVPSPVSSVVAGLDIQVTIQEWDDKLRCTQSWHSFRTWTLWH